MSTPELQFEYDPEKSQSNKSKHGIDFEEAQALWDDPAGLLLSQDFASELRHMLIGRIGNIYWSAIFTYRGEKVRLISVRRARLEERDIYEES